MAKVSDFSRRANCGCVHHADKGIPCNHDIAELSYDELMDYLCALIDECNRPPRRKLLPRDVAEARFADEIKRLVAECRMPLDDSRQYWTKRPN